MTKKELRNIYSEKRKQLPLQQKNKLDDLLLIGFQKLKLSAIHFLFIYLPLAEKQEPETSAMARYLSFLNPGLQVAIPKIDWDSGDMEAIVINDHTEFELNKYGMEEPKNGKIVEPKQVDLILVPLLAFDSRGYRVGFGKGFYDKYLHRCRKDTISVGLSYFAPVEKISDTHAFDVPLKYCITPDRVYEF